MPQQFIKVKENTGVVPNAAAFTGSVNKQDWDSSSNLSNSTGDICRICGRGEPPVVAVLLLRKPQRYVHQACLRQWLAASDTRSCELCKFNFILHTKIKPFSEWRILEMSSVERRRLLCAILFHFVAAVCVVWSLFVLIDRAAEEVQKGLIACRCGCGVHRCCCFLCIYSADSTYICFLDGKHTTGSSWCRTRRRSRVPCLSSSYFHRDSRQHMPSQVVTIAEYNQPSSETNSNSQNDLQLCYVKCCSSSASSIQKADVHVEDLCETPRNEAESREAAGDPSRSNILALDIECPADSKKKYSLQSPLKTETARGGGAVFKSLPNLSTSSENLLL
ncbi:hypothetical protein NQ318_020176 [Aromia moschata]|uniref:RING-CH-type domain-containing protein n=1 Tax=Aromia moschata TaxID=1265417 RepID=A0AAV8Z9A5_9CUCU|nr:hypothetical protein NQ318_020176 [Aromia moschata]